VVATLGALTAGGVVLVALLLGDITVGAQNASLVLQLPPQMGEIVSSLLMLAVISVLVLRRYRISWRRSAGGSLGRSPGGSPGSAPPTRSAPPAPAAAGSVIPGAASGTPAGHPTPGSSS
jgi:general nucleoside transport system permease protein